MSLKWESQDLYRISKMTFRTTEDIEAKFPFPEELEEDQGVYMFRGRIIVPQDLVEHILSEEFKDIPPALGRDKFFYLLREKYIGITQKGVQRFLANNHDHQVRRNVVKYSVQKRLLVNGPYKRYIFDLTNYEVGARVKYLFNCCDAFSKYVWSIPIGNKTGRTIAECLRTVFGDDPPSTLGSDNALEFKSPEVKALCEENGVRQVHGNPHDPTSQSQVERMNSTLLRLLNSYRDDRSGREIKHFKVALRHVVDTINKTVSESTGMTPETLHNKELPNKTLLEVQARLRGSEQLPSKKNLHKPLQRGDAIRIASFELDPALKALRKAGKMKGYGLNFSREVYTVKLQRKDGYVLIEQFPGKIFRRDAILEVNVS